MTTQQEKKSELAFLRSHSRPLAHMRRQQEYGRFGLIIGSGVSATLGFPCWAELVERIAAHPLVGGAQLFGALHREQQKPLPIVSEVLFQRFRERNIDEIKRQESNPNTVLRLLGARWLGVIHSSLYADVPAKDEDLLAKDTVYKYFLDAVRGSALTINYNFDDSLQRLLLHTRTEEQRRRGRGFETVADPTLQFGLSKGVIYHPNGHLPLNLLERTSERLIFNEESFADQLMETMAGVYSSLIHHLSKNTCLLIGLSLEDETLRHILHRSALLSPGHYHYYIEYVSGARDPASELYQRLAYFDAYNLITLFLGSEEIGALGRCLGMSVPDLRVRGQEARSRLHYTYYITGVPGVGKSTTVAHLKNLATYDEWLNERLPEMAKDHLQLSAEDIGRIDGWVREQNYLKNLRLLADAHDYPYGIVVVDRCIPDAVAFSKPGEYRTKAADLLTAINPESGNVRAHPGHVILLVGDPEEIRVRAATKNKERSAQHTKDLQDLHRMVYPEGATISYVNVHDLSIAEVVKQVARVIHLQEYEPCEIQNLLEAIQSGAQDVRS